MRGRTRLAEQQNGRGLTIAHALWAVLALVSVTTLAASTILDHSYAAIASRGWTPESYRVALATLGLGPSSVDALYITLATIIRLAVLSIGFVIFWRKPDDQMALFVSGFLVTFSVSAVNIGDAARNDPLVGPPVKFLEVLGQSCLMLFLFVFPDGRFVPGWTRWPTIAAVIFGVVVTVLPPPSGPAWIVAWLWFLWLFMSFPAQFYRYWRVSTLAQRQQTKIVVLGIAAQLVGAVLGFMLPVFVIEPSVPVLNQPTAEKLIFDFITGTLINTLGFLALPLSIGLAILRYRLWDIDLLIRRTLVYSTLTALLALFYFGSVVLLQQLFRALTGQGRNEIVTVVSTLAIAALFVPLRGRVQRVIDQRFFRRKYDAARTLEAFGTAVRDEVDLSELREHLLRVVDETMQPTQVSLWLRTPERELKR